MKINHIDYSGLSFEDVENRKQQGKINIVDNHITKSYYEIFSHNIFTFFNLINAILLAMILFVGSYKNMLFIFIIITNTAAGIYQEIKAKKTLDRLSVLTYDQVDILRNNEIKSIKIDEIVLDDYLILTNGNQVPTDCMLIEGHLEVNEALLTGESDAILKEKGQKLYSGSYITSGKGMCQVIHVGEDNYVHKIIKEAKASRQHNSQLNQSLDKILKIISILIVPIGILLFLKQIFVGHTPFPHAVISTVAALLGMIPEGLVLLTSVALTISVLRLAKQKTLVQELFCIETLARVDTICLDKTGTLTEGKLEVVDYFSFHNNNIHQIISNMNYYLNDKNVTSLALQTYFGKNNDLHASYTIPFSSERKYSAVSFENIGTFYIGAYQFVFPKGIEDLEEKCREQAEKGYRVLVIGHSYDQVIENELLSDLTPVGMIIFSDVIRENAKETLDYFKNQNVDIKIISGDDPITVSSIAKKAGIKKYKSYIDASTLKSIDAMEKAVNQYSIFGRVTPLQKKQMVLALQKQGHTVAMTGDGINDILAFKVADCSIAMASGSDAAKNAANLILLNNNFDAMPHIVNEGRRVINNISASASMFLIKTIFSIVLAIGTIFFGHAYPFEPIQLSIIGGCCVGIPTFFLTYESNFQKVEGHFLYRIFKNAFPYAMTIAVTSTIIVNVGRLFDINSHMLSTVCVLLTGWCYFRGLLSVYSPLTFYRKMIIYIMQIVYFFCLIIGHEFLSLANLNYYTAIILIAIITLSDVFFEFYRIIFDKGYHFFQKHKSHK